MLAVPAGPYADTTGDGSVAYYAVAAVADGQSAGPLSAPVAAAPLPGGGGVVTVDVGERAGQLDRPWQPMIGSEHLSYLLSRDRTGGRLIGAELRAALRIARDELGVRAVRAHGILCDDLGVYRQGRPPDFSGVDRVYDELMSLRLRPVVELSFMPRDLARDPGRTVFSYQAVISPPADWDRWGDLCAALASHLVQRYGADEVTGRWAFEVWNEPNLDVFWAGTQQEYFRLYDVSARAVKSVHPGLRVGGPASAAAGWTRELLAHTAASGAPLDFLSSHVYGNVPIDLRAGELPVWWTEWGATPTHFNRVGDTVFAAAFLLRGMASALGRVEALSHWVASDHFEELGAPPELFHGGFGLLSVGNLRKPRYWALRLLAGLGRHRLRVQLRGDGAGRPGPGAGRAARRRAHRDPGLERHPGPGQDRRGRPARPRDPRARAGSAGRVVYRPALPHRRGALQHRPGLGEAAGRRRLAAGRPVADAAELNTLDELVPPARVTGGLLELAFELPMPGVSYLELAP